MQISIAKESTEKLWEFRNRCENFAASLMKKGYSVKFIPRWHLSKSYFYVGGQNGQNRRSSLAKRGSKNG